MDQLNKHYKIDKEALSAEYLIERQAKRGLIIKDKNELKFLHYMINVVGYNNLFNLDNLNGLIEKSEDIDLRYKYKKNIKVTAKDIINIFWNTDKAAGLILNVVLVFERYIKVLFIRFFLVKNNDINKNNKLETDFYMKCDFFKSFHQWRTFFRRNLDNFYNEKGEFKSGFTVINNMSINSFFTTVTALKNEYVHIFMKDILGKEILGTPDKKNTLFKKITKYISDARNCCSHTEESILKKIILDTEVKEWLNGALKNGFKKFIKTEKIENETKTYELIREIIEFCQLLFNDIKEDNKISLLNISYILLFLLNLKYNIFYQRSTKNSDIFGPFRDLKNYIEIINILNKKPHTEDMRL